MQVLKLIILISFLAYLPLTTVAQETNQLDVDQKIAEFVEDDITAEELGIEEPTILPGESGYWWTNFKRNLSIWFTFDAETKAKKLEELASIKLLEAKKLAIKGTANASEQVLKNLDKYEEVMQKVIDKLADNPNIKDKVLEKFDANQLRHQQLMREVSDKLSDKVDSAKIEEMARHRKQQALKWYNAHKEKLQERLEKAVDNTDDGSKFKQLRNIATLEELQETLPEEALAKIEAAKEKAQERLSEKLDNVDAEKIDDYIEDIEIPEVNKQAFVENLQDTKDLAPAVKTKLQNVATDYASRLKNSFESLSSIETKRKFLQNFDTRAHPSYLKFLESIEVPEELQAIYERLRQQQQEGIRAKIRQTTDPLKLQNLQNNLQSIPVLYKEVLEQQINRLRIQQAQ